MELILAAAFLVAVALLVKTHVDLKRNRDDKQSLRDEIEKEKALHYEKILELQVDIEQLKKGTKELQSELFNAQDELGAEREKNRTLLSQKKSSETRLGQISEHLIPFLDKCRHDPKNMHFLGNPIDYLVFDFDQGEITFLEIKSGNSKPSKRQKVVKNIIKTGRIKYEEMRINEKGVRSKIAENLP